MAGGQWIWMGRSRLAERTLASSFRRYPRTDADFNMDLRADKFQHIPAAMGLREMEPSDSPEQDSI
jgi:hypothetical protein